MSRAFIRSLLALALLFVAVALLPSQPAHTGTTLTGNLTIPSPTLVQPGSILSGQALRIGESITNTFNPALTGMQRPVGSVAYTRDGTAAWLKTRSPSTGWEPVGAGSAIGTRSSYLNALGFTRMGLTGASTTFSCFHEDFIANPVGGANGTYTSLAAGTGALVVSTVDVGGKVGLNSGATANSFYLLVSNATVFPAPSGSPRLYFAARSAVTTAIDAQTFAVVGMQLNGFAAAVNLGVCGNSSTANFVFQYDGTDCAGTFLSTSQPINTSYHLWEIWMNADGKYHSAVDGIEFTGSGVTPAAAPAAAMRLEGDARNGTTATARNLQIDWFHACWVEG